MSLTLYYSPGACSMAAHIALEEAGAMYGRKLVSVHEGQTQGAEYLRINPRARVPALEVDGQVLVETCAILSYIANRFPQANLMPQDPLAQAQCLSKMAWFASHVHTAFAHVAKPSRFSNRAEALDSIKDTGAQTYWAALQEIDAMLGAHTWMCGEQFTVCDAHALPFWGFGRRVRMPMEDLKNYTAWKDRMVARPAVRAVLEIEESRLLPQRAATP